VSYAAQAGQLPSVYLSAVVQARDIRTLYAPTTIAPDGPSPRFRFHVDDLSSAHVYLRLPEGTDIDAIPAETLEDCCQLVRIPLAG
jgi:NFACT protein RNA binding domain